jgi:hypothetical protein
MTARLLGLSMQRHRRDAGSLLVEALNTASAPLAAYKTAIPRRSGHKRRSVLWYGLAHFFLDFHADAFYMFTGFSGAQYLATAAMVSSTAEGEMLWEKNFPGV